MPVSATPITCATHLAHVRDTRARAGGGGTKGGGGTAGGKRARETGWSKRSGWNLGEQGRMVWYFVAMASRVGRCCLVLSVGRCGPGLPATPPPAQSVRPLSVGTGAGANDKKSPFARFHPHNSALWPLSFVSNLPLAYKQARTQTWGMRHIPPRYTCCYRPIRSPFNLSLSVSLSLSL